MKRKITVGVTGLNNIDSPGPGIPVIRALKESKFFDVRTIGLSYEALEPGLYLSDLVDKSYQIPMPSAGTSALLERLEYVNQKENLQVIIPNFDAELHNFIRLSDDLKSKLNINTFLPTQKQFEERHKEVLYEFGKKYDIKIPFSKNIFSEKEIYQAQDLAFPLVIKGKYYDANIVYSVEQAVDYYYKLSGKWGLPVILQEFVSGNEVNVTAIGDGKGNCVGAVPMRKLYITDKGKAWAGIALDDKKLLKIASDVISKSKWKGGCELEFIKTKDNEYYLIELNPRFPAWVYLAVGCGQNHPEQLLQLALGESVQPLTKYDVGKMFIRYSMDNIVDLKKFEQISTKGEL